MYTFSYKNKIKIDLKFFLNIDFVILFFLVKVFVDGGKDINQLIAQSAGND